ncbi:hypothetical protein FH972_015275 [Carpinus fangiana]|uniref:Uncharacterized protein n=1 Tax=Carpinus fangiana TaxID=176857 RepID=A0A5N6RF08_9ROSI|nr:hypothetical protein FH972_015275 [Carpinus fangiana]
MATAEARPRVKIKAVTNSEYYKNPKLSPSSSSSSPVYCYLAVTIFVLSGQVGVREGKRHIEYICTIHLCQKFGTEKTLAQLLKPRSSSHDSSVRFEH